MGKSVGRNITTGTVWFPSRFFHFHTHGFCCPCHNHQKGLLLPLLRQAKLRWQKHPMWTHQNMTINTAYSTVAV